MTIELPLQSHRLKNIFLCGATRVVRICEDAGSDCNPWGRWILYHPYTTCTASNFWLKPAIEFRRSWRGAKECSRMGGNNTRVLWSFCTTLLILSHVWVLSCCKCHVHDPPGNVLVGSASTAWKYDSLVLVLNGSCVNWPPTVESKIGWRAGLPIFV